METINYTDDELDKKLKMVFTGHQGKDKAIPRWELVSSVYGAGSDTPRNDGNTRDRDIRDAVERLRNHGWLILNMNDGRGRFLCSTEDEYWEWRSRYMKQLKSIAATIRSMDRFAKVKYPNLFQPSLFGSEVMEELTEIEAIGG
jgi:hypothetical protein